MYPSGVKRDAGMHCINSHSPAIRLSVAFAGLLLVLISCCYGAGDKAQLRGLVVSSVLVDPQEYTADGGRYDLYLQAIPQGKTTRLTNHQANPKLQLGGAIRKPLFSHDGERVLFLADRATSDLSRTTMTGAAPYPNTFLNIWILKLDTRVITPITKGDLGWTVFGWSPDDRFICATYPTRHGSLDEGKSIPDDLYVWDTLTQKGRKLARVPDGVYDAFWSHDGSRVMYQTGPNANLYSIPRRGGKSKVLLRGKPGRFGYAFSSDGRKVAYVDTDTVYVANADGSKPKPIIKMVRDEHSPYFPGPRWSRDGEKLAIAIRERSKTGRVSSMLHVYGERTGKDTVVAMLHRPVSDPIWSRNGQWLIVKVSNTGSSEKPDPKTGWHTFRREGLLAVSTADGRVTVLKEPDKETKGLDWFETE